MNKNSEVLENDPRKEVWSAWQGAVLLSNEIRYYATQCKQKLIDPFEESNLKPASYDLTLGSECRVGGKPVLLDKNNRYLEIPPYDIATISTHEKLNIPRFLIGRWNLRIKFVYEGLLWVGGPQVDPGYRGHLYCPLYNLSDRTVRIEYREPIATIDFVRTTPFIVDCKKFESKREDKISAHDIHFIKSGPFKAWRRLDALDRRMNSIQATIFTILGIIIAALSIMSASPFLKIIEAPSAFQITLLIISVIALLLAVVAIIVANRRNSSGS